MKRIVVVERFPLLVILTLALVSCDAEQPSVETNTADPPVASLVGETIPASELDAPLLLQLYDLQEAAYKLRMQRLLKLVEIRWGVEVGVDSATGANGPSNQRLAELQILLQPPARPRLTLALGTAPLRGDASAPVSLALFCDFVSLQCRRLQPVMASLLARFVGLLQLRHVDAPRPFHRGSAKAAAAARCAQEQGQFWTYHDALYADPAPPSERRLSMLAGLLRLDVPVFELCLASGDGHRAVQRDLSLAERIGVRSVPVAFVNGLYLKGVADHSTYAALIVEELARLGLEPPGPDTASDTSVWERLGLRLVETTVQDNPDRSTASFRLRNLPGQYSFAVGKHVVYGYRLLKVAPDAAVLVGPNEDRIELHIAELQSHSDAVAGQDTPVRSTGRAALRLPRALIDEALRDTDALEAALKPGRLDVGGSRLLKLDRVEPGSLYDWLGLQQGDLLLQVDDEFVLDQRNPLWQALRDQERVTLTIVRKGIARTTDYVIDAPGEAAHPNTDLE